jgi:gamma-glutamyl:cysteine ligase YbdK (ATP-grasp superfamily)
VSAPLGLLEGFGLELELMIVDAASLDVRPLADRPLFEASGRTDGDHDNGRISWSNELVRHVIELKTTGPERGIHGIASLGAAFQSDVREVAALLAPHGARLMPGGTHPWMDPRREAELWPFDYADVYRAYDRIFDCRTHGWANLQSVHINLSFAGDAEFARLHAAVRLVLPLIPALAASTPVMSGALAGALDQRLEVYRTNSTRVPRMTGEVIPEPVWTRAEYEREILAPLLEAVAALDPSGVLQGEWLNARGAIARFDRDAIEIRVTDTQECPRADVAVAWAVRCVVATLCDERWASLAAQQQFASAPLAALLRDAIRLGPAARVTDAAYARALGWRASAAPSLGELWRGLIEQSVAPAPGSDAELLAPLETIVEHGTLAQRLLAALGPVVGRGPDRARLRTVWGALCDDLAHDRLFLPRASSETPA